MQQEGEVGKCVPEEFGKFQVQVPRKMSGKDGC